MNESLQLSPKKYLSSPGLKPKPILRTTAYTYQIIKNGKDMTPKPLNQDLYRVAKARPSHSSITEKESNATIGTGTAPSEAPIIKSILRFRSDIELTTVQGSVYGDGSLDMFKRIESSTGKVEVSDELIGYEALAVVEPVETTGKMRIPPTHISLTLSETNTFFVLDIPSCIEIKDTEEGNEAEKENEEYEYLTEGKGRNRKVVDAEAQTAVIFKKSRNTAAAIVRTKNDKTFASNWEMHDTYHETIEKVESSSSSDESDGGDLRTIASEAVSAESIKIGFDENKVLKIFKSFRFQEAVCIVERLMANNLYNEQQKRFSGLSDPDMFREDIQYKYRLQLLWTFTNTSSKGRCVSAIEWNPENHDLVAVGYGKFYFSEITTGIVMIWNIKNPVQPERSWNFEAPVTTLSFSKQDPNLLAIGFYDGLVNIIDISKRELYIVGQNISSFECVWSVLWRINHDHPRQEEQVCAASDDGKIVFYSIGNSREMQSQQMMRVAKADGKLKGFNSMRKCTSLAIPVSRYAGAKFIRLHPSDPTIYLVGTNEGVVHKCSTNYLNQHLDLFLAHEGPINDLQYSPFSKKIYATCGDDWHLRLWAEGVDEPLQELFVEMYSVQGMAWSPTHSTILATIYDKTILLWDFQRKVWKPQSQTQSPTGSRNTVVQFTQSGRCLTVGDVDGNVHVFSLEDMPFSAFFQENLLFHSLEKSLTTHPITMEKLRKIRRDLLFQQKS